MQEEVATIYSAIGNRCYKNLSCAEYDARSVCFSTPPIQSQRHPQHTILDGSLGITVLAFNTLCNTVCVRGTLLLGPWLESTRSVAGRCKRTIRWWPRSDMIVPKYKILSPNRSCLYRIIKTHAYTMICDPIRSSVRHTDISSTGPASSYTPLTS